MSQPFRGVFLSSAIGVAALVAAGLLPSTRVFAQPSATAIRGRLLDGAASAANIRPEVLRDPSAEWQIPLAEQQVEIRAFGDSSRSWVVESDGDGHFTFDPAASGVPENTPCVAFAEVGGRRLFSPSFDPRARKPRIFLYPVGANSDQVQTVTTIVHTIEKRSNEEGETERWLNVQIRVEFWNWGHDLFIGESKAGSREIWRVPLPPGARIEKNTGVAPGTRGRYSDDGRFLIWDEPVAGLADLVEGRRSGRTRNAWDIEYRIRPTPLFTMEYPLGLAPADRQRGVELGGFRVYAMHEDMQVGAEEKDDEKKSDSMKVESTHLERGFDVKENPIDGSAAHLDVYLPRGASPVAADGTRRPMLVPVQISDAARGVISRKALFWHGGTIFIGITAVLFGLLLSRKGPPAEAILDGLSSEEVLDRIAELDKRYERNEISKADYDRYRESLVTIAAEEISGETSAAREADGAAASAAPPPQPAFGPRTREMLREIHDLDETDLPSAEQIQQRAHLLEALYKSLKKDLES